MSCSPHINRRNLICNKFYFCSFIFSGCKRKTATCEGERLTPQNCLPTLPYTANGWQPSLAINAVEKVKISHAIDYS